MVVQHNISAMNAQRQLNITTEQKSKESEKLSSGYRINRGADDAAGLSISEKMRKQIRGLTRATTNIEDGISLCKVADGAIAEMHDMIHRMNELSIQAANGTNSDTDREYIQMEIDQIVTECGRIIETTKFNELYLFKGNETPILSLDGIEYQQIGTRYYEEEPYIGDGLGNVNGVTAYTGGNLGDTLLYDLSLGTWENASKPLTDQETYHCAWIDFSGIQANSAEELEKLLWGQGFDSSCSQCTNKFYGVKFSKNEGNTQKTAAGTSYSYQKHTTSNSTTSQPVTFEIIKLNIQDLWNNYENKKATDASCTLGETICESLIDAINTAGQNADSNLISHYTSYTYLKGTGKFYILSNTGTGSGCSTFSLKPRTSDGSFGTEAEAREEPINRLIIHTKLEEKDTSIHAGAESDRTNKVMIDLPTMSIDSLELNRVCVLTQDLATESIEILNRSLKALSTHRSRMGAYQNRLEHAEKNLDNVVENTQASESQIRDTDMSEEMVSYSNSSILEQAGQAMLSQANKNQQGIVTLLN